MAAEWWDPPSHLNARLAVCGHSMLQQDSPSLFRENGKDLMKCAACDCVQPPTFSVRDGVPSENLAWGEARCTHRLDFGKQSQNKVLHYGCRVF